MICNESWSIRCSINIIKKETKTRVHWSWNDRLGFDSFLVFLILNKDFILHTMNAVELINNKHKLFLWGKWKKNSCDLCKYEMIPLEWTFLYSNFSLWIKIHQIFFRFRYLNRFWLFQYFIHNLSLLSNRINDTCWFNWFLGLLRKLLILHLFFVYLFSWSCFLRYYFFLKFFLHGIIEITDLVNKWEVLRLLIIQHML